MPEHALLADRIIIDGSLVPPHCGALHGSRVNLAPVRQYILGCSPPRIWDESPIEFGTLTDYREVSCST